MAKKLVDEYKDPGAGDEKKVRILREFVKWHQRGEEWARTKGKESAEGHSEEM